MSEMKQSKCPTCGANVTVPPGTTRAKCEYCGSSYTVQMDHGEAILMSNQQLSGAIKESSQQTLTELQRMQLGQQRAQLAQQYTSIRLHLDTLESELRTLQRTPATRVTKKQIKDLEDRRKEIRDQLQMLQTEMTNIDRTLNPQQASSSTKQSMSAVGPERPPLPAGANLADRAWYGFRGYSVGQQGCLWIIGYPILFIILAFRSGSPRWLKIVVAILVAVIFIIAILNSNDKPNTSGMHELPSRNVAQHVQEPGNHRIALNTGSLEQLYSTSNALPFISRIGDRQVSLTHLSI